MNLVIVGRCWLVAFGLALGGILLMALPSLAGILDASWTAPTTNVDGSPLTDLASYRIYYGVSSAPCPGPSFLQVTSATPSPVVNEIVASRLTGLATGTLYFVSVTAVDTSGNESDCFSPAQSVVARIDFGVSPTGTVDFGIVNLGSFVDQAFSVQNTGGGTVSGTVSTAAPFSIVTGSPFTLVGAGATKTVTVRFTPTVAATASANVTFTANGGSVSRIATGSVAPDTTRPTVSITAPATGAALTGTATVAATATDNVGVVGVQFKLDGANLGAEVTTAPYAMAWNTGTATNGVHTLTSVARDAAGNVATSLGVNVTVANDITPPVISGVTTSSVTSSSATISWATSEASDTQVEYGPTTAYGSLTPLDGSPVTGHAQTVNGLAASAVYHYRVKSRDAAGNLAVSGDFVLTTLADPASGLTGYWPFDQSAGTTAPDASGNGNPGALVNGPTWTSGRIGQALSFDGIDDYVSVAHAATLNAYPLTMVAWSKTSASAGVRGILHKYDGTFNGYQVFMDSGNLCAWYFRDSANHVYDGTGCPLSTPGYADNQWHHVVLVVDAGGGRLYVDGVQRASRAWTGTPGASSTTQNLIIGHDAGTVNPSYLGVLDEVRVYNRALSATEVSQLYAGGAGGDTTPPALSGITASSITTSSATVRWTSNEASDTQVEYGLTTAYGSVMPRNANLVASHSQALSGLAPGTLYHYRVKSRDAAGNLAVSGDLTFRTAAEAKKKRRDWFDSLSQELGRLF